MTKLRLIGIGLLIVALGFLLHKCNRDPKPDTTVTLTTDDQSKVAIKGNKVTVVKRTPDGSTSTETKFVPKNAVITHKKSGEIVVYVKQAGWTAEPGIGVIGSSEGLAMSLDVRVGYWRRMGLNVGTGIRLGTGAKTMNEIVKDTLRPFVAVSYQLPFDVVSNTSALLGYEPIHKQVCLGVRVKF